MTPTMLRAMGKRLLDDVGFECTNWFNKNEEVPLHVQTGLVILSGLGNACKAAADAGDAAEDNLLAKLSVPGKIEAIPDGMTLQVIPGHDRLAMLAELEDICRQNCGTRKVDRDYNGQVAGTLVTDSGAISAHADGLRRLAKHFRFRIVADGGRMVVGYWPENDPEKNPTSEPVAKGVVVEETSHG